MLGGAHQKRTHLMEPRAFERTLVQIESTKDEPIQLLCNIIESNYRVLQCLGFCFFAKKKKGDISHSDQCHLRIVLFISIIICIKVTQESTFELAGLRLRLNLLGSMVYSCLSSGNCRRSLQFHHYTTLFHLSNVQRSTSNCPIISD